MSHLHRCSLAKNWTFFAFLFFASIRLELAQLQAQENGASEGLPAHASHLAIKAGEGLAIDLIDSEPSVAQPSFIRFDERGRMWVVQYRQYPLPAGLAIASRDNFWRNAYDRIPAAPGSEGHVPGADVITIHEDTDGDGSFDKVTPFLEGLSLATSLAWDRDGVWVLQAPYLLFYRDANHDDVVDGPPEVHLSGFGIEDSHAIVNSLTWGPDGWLYAAQGSTVTAAVQVADTDRPAIKSIGQQIWRYHPKKRIYEVFAEGGGNIWSCQFDSKGRLFAGTNQGRVVGYHYLQGSYSRKSFTKHGSLSNPYAYGYFKGIEEPDVKRVTTNLMVYEERALPERYQGAVLSANPLTGRVRASRLEEKGPSFSARNIDAMFEASDRWVRPVYLETGPDGAVYVADWYDQQVNHYQNHQGRISPSDGRIYRIRPEDNYQPPSVNMNLKALSGPELAYLLRDERRWYRDTARRLINERQDTSLIPLFEKWLNLEKGQTALEALWAINLLGGFDSETRRAALEHTDPHVRVWGIRLIGDEGKASRWESEKMGYLAAVDTNIEVRQQLAASAKRLGGRSGLAITESLMRRDDDAEDVYMPMMVWWALESACSEDAAQVVAMFEDETLFRADMVKKSLLRFTMRRLASEGTRSYLGECARLLRYAEDGESKAFLLEGFEEAFRGRSMLGLPEELLAELAKLGGGSVAMQIRQGIPESIAEARRLLLDGDVDRSELRRVIEALGEVPEASLLDALFARLERVDVEMQEIVLSSLRAYGDSEVGERVVAMYPKFEPKLRAAAQTLLLSRPSWSIQWVQSVVDGAQGNEIPYDARSHMRRIENMELDVLLDRIEEKGVVSNNSESEKIASILNAREFKPDVYRGRDYYVARCAACHTLHGEGGAIGPELTGYQRQDRESLLFAITDPNAEIREGYENYLVRTKDGQLLSGFIVDQDEHVVVLRPAGGQPIVVEQNNIASVEGAGVSLMPPGLLAGMDDQAIADFFAYLQSSQPLNLR